MSDPITLARTLLAAVAELHVRGYHGLRLHPGMNASGTAWRCELHVMPDTTLIRYSSGSGDRLAEGIAIGTDPHQLATEIERAYAGVLAAARIEDPQYVSWFSAMMQSTNPRAVPIAYADYGNYDKQWGSSPDVGRLPLPPPAPPLRGR